MTFTVYAIRLRGSTQARYIGQTSQNISARLTSHFGERSTSYRTGGDPFANWLFPNRERIEIISMSTHATRADAKVAEVAAIKVCLSLGHRLLNRDHVPAPLRAICKEQDAA